ncbi:hypothetical protein F53441_5395 [Fusarium austroafricanum]|uniref:Chromo domain-containing protein n=1 Tax=Fusarium austroafricanum TaxID=2364996 RepID=A0A8H4KK26_9HYPO|nr:hypothetical protein F53441_5395 [Fusarium austroafricanum]
MASTMQTARKSTRDLEENARLFAFGTHRYITGHIVHEDDFKVTLSVKWRKALEDQWKSDDIEEFLLQNVDEEIVLNYWRDLGGREKVTGLDQYHILRILGETTLRYKVQWVGYGVEEATLETKYMVNKASRARVNEWLEKKNQDKKKAGRRACRYVPY